MRFTSPTLAISYISARAASQIFASQEAREVKTAPVAIAKNTNESTSSSNGSLQDSTTAKAKEGAECSFANDVKAKLYDADTGVLVCGIGETCIEDKLSSVGGRCIIIHPRTAAENHRQLTAISCQFADGTNGFKCQGNYACEGVDPNTVECGGCIGDNSCYQIKGTVAENSCVGVGACDRKSGAIEARSCIGDWTCSWIKCMCVVVC
jgi:hypothetical protein